MMTWRDAINAPKLDKCTGNRIDRWKDIAKSMFTSLLFIAYCDRRTITGTHPGRDWHRFSPQRRDVIKNSKLLQSENIMRTGFMLDCENNWISIFHVIQILDLASGQPSYQLRCVLWNRTKGMNWNDFFHKTIDDLDATNLLQNNE